MTGKVGASRLVRKGDYVEAFEMVQFSEDVDSAVSLFSKNSVSLFVDLLGLKRLMVAVFFYFKKKAFNSFDRRGSG